MRLATAQRAHLIVFEFKQRFNALKAKDLKAKWSNLMLSVLVTSLNREFNQSWDAQDKENNQVVENEPNCNGEKTE